MTYDLGVIGGMGPLATQLFLRYLIDGTQASSDQDHINTVLLNHVSLPDRTRAIFEGKDESFLEAVNKDIDLLNSLDLNAIAIPCNTSHYFYEEMAFSSSNSIIHMPLETLKWAVKQGHKKFVVFSTFGTKKTGLYSNLIASLKLEEVEVEEKDQEKIMEIIYNIKERDSIDELSFSKLIDKYSEQGIIILGCTELSLLPYDESKVIDPMKILAKKAIESCGKEIKDGFI